MSAQMEHGCHISLIRVALYSLPVATSCHAITHLLVQILTLICLLAWLLRQWSVCFHLQPHSLQCIC